MSLDRPGPGWMPRHAVAVASGSVTAWLAWRSGGQLAAVQTAGGLTLLHLATASLIGVVLCVEAAVAAVRLSPGGGREEVTWYLRVTSAFGWAVLVGLCLMPGLALPAPPTASPEGRVFAAVADLIANELSVLTAAFVMSLPLPTALMLIVNGSHLWRTRDRWRTRDH